MKSFDLDAIAWTIALFTVQFVFLILVDEFWF